MAWIGCHIWLEWAWIWQNILMGFKKKIGWAKFGPKRLNGPAEPGRTGLGPRKKNPINNWAGSGSWVLARGSGLGMQKSGPNRLVAIPNYYCPKYSKATLITRWSETAQQNYFRPSTSSTCLNQHLHWMLRLKQQVNLFALNC